MFTLLIVYMLNNEIQTIQVDGFSSREACERAYHNDLELSLASIAMQANAKISPICIAKE